MTAVAKHYVEEFLKLDRAEQEALYQAIARTVVPDNYGPLSDDDLTAIAARTFALLDREESCAEAR